MSKEEKDKKWTWKDTVLWLLIGYFITDIAQMIANRQIQIIWINY